MSAEYSEEGQSLLAEVRQSEQALERLEGELRLVDDELAEFGERRHQFDVLSQVCRSLEELDAIGASQLFWHEQDGPRDSAAHREFAKRQIDAFGEQVAKVESRRQAIIDKIGAQNDTLDYLHYDLRDAVEEEEKRRNEWIIEREPTPLPARVQIMPWARGSEEDKRLRKSLGASIAASIGVALLVSVVAIPMVERTTVDELPERVAKLVRKQRIPPPPPKVAELVEPEPEPPEPKLVEELPKEPTTQPVVAEVEAPAAQEQVKAKGILAFRDSFAERAEFRSAAQLGSNARISTVGQQAVGRTARKMVTTSAPGSSGGINLADISRDVGGGGQALEGVQVSRVASSIGATDGADRPLSGGRMAGRTDEEIQIVFDRYKASLYRLYNRELRKNPTLRGQLVLRLTIEPDGSVSLCELHQSDMKAPLLAQQVVDRVSAFDFGAKEDISAITIVYPIDFLPAV